MSVFKVIYNTEHTQTNLKLSGAKLCTAGSAFKYTGDDEITPVTATTDQPGGLFGVTVTATNTDELGKNGEVMTVHDGAVVESDNFETTDAPDPESDNIVYFTSAGVPKGGTSGAGTYAIGKCQYNDGSRIRFAVNCVKATSL